MRVRNSTARARLSSLLPRRHRLGLALSLLLVPHVSAGDVVQRWARLHGNPGKTDEAVELATDADGNSYVTGWSFAAAGPSSSYDIVTVKYDRAGNELWARIYDRSNTWDQGKGIAVDPAGNVYVIGFSSGSQVTIKYSSDGEQQWAAVYPASSLLSFNKNQDVAVDDAGNVYVCGHTYNQATGQDVLVLKYLPDGLPGWVQTYAIPLDNEAWNIGVVGGLTGGVYVTGSSHLGGENFEITTLKFDPAGPLLWARTFGGPQRDIAYALIADSSGVYVAGTSFVLTQGQNAVTVKYDPLGNLLWSAIYNGLGNDYDGISDIAVDAQQNVYVCGQSANAPYPVVDFDGLLIKYGPLGLEEWVRKHDGPAPASNDYFYELEVDATGVVYATGDEFEGPAYTDNDRNIVTVAYDASGALVWSANYDGPGYSVDYGRSLAIDPNGDVVVCGLADQLDPNDGIDYDYVTVRYHVPTLGAGGPAAGSPHTIQVFPHPVGRQGIARIAFDAPTAGAWVVRIHDLAGRAVARWEVHAAGRGPVVTSWNAARPALKPGAYWVLVSRHGEEAAPPLAARKLVVLD
jgi:frataxin-like iron-binding protein CyaY